MIFTQMTKTKMILLKVNQMKILTMAKILLKYGFDQDVIELAFTMTPNHILEIRNTRKSLTDIKNLESASTILKSL